VAASVSFIFISKHREGRVLQPSLFVLSLFLAALSKYQYFWLSDFCALREIGAGIASLKRES